MPSDTGRGGVGVRLVVVVVAVVLAAWGLVGEDVQLVHLGSRVHDHQLVLGNVCGCRRQVGDGLALHTLEVHVAALALLLLPGHPDEGPLDVVVDDLWATPRALLHLLFVGGVTWEG